MSNSLPLRRRAIQALRRVAAGLPIFETPARGSGRFWRPILLRDLYEGGYLRHGNWAPELTDRGRAAIRLDYTSRKFTPEQVAQIKRLYPEIGPSALAERYGISAKAMIMHGERLGLRRRARRWPEAHDALIVERYSVDGARAISALIDRPPSHVRARARRLGVCFGRFVTVNRARSTDRITQEASP